MNLLFHGHHAQSDDPKTQPTAWWPRLKNTGGSHQWIKFTSLPWPLASTSTCSFNHPLPWLPLGVERPSFPKHMVLIDTTLGHAALSVSNAFPHPIRKRSPGENPVHLLFVAKVQWHLLGIPTLPRLAPGVPPFWKIKKSRVFEIRSEISISQLWYVQSLSCVWFFVAPGSSVHGIFQASTLEWVAISSFRGSSWPRDRTQGSNPGLLSILHWQTDSLPLAPPGKPWYFWI